MLGAGTLGNELSCQESSHTADHLPSGAVRLSPSASAPNAILKYGWMEMKSFILKAISRKEIAAHKVLDLKDNK